MDRQQRGAIQAFERSGFGRRDFVVAVEDGPFHFGQIIALAPNGICSGIMSTQTVRLHRWDEIALEKVTEMLSRKVVTGEREMLAQIYLKRGCLVPMHSHESEQMTYILQGALKFLIGGEEITVREGELLHIPSWVEHQAEALDDTFELDVFSPIREDWLNHTDDYFHR
jgi:quercetin dioxygenase-like cupin family protein